MITLQITEAKAKKLDEVEDLALDTIRKALKGDIAADAVEVKVASTTLSVVSRNRQTSTHRSVIEFGMASSIATDGQLKKYIEVTNPQVQKALMGKK